MKKHYKIFIVGILTLICHLSLDICHLALAVGEAGQDIPVLEIGIGARPLGMGKAFSAMAGDINSAYFNPAGLSQLKDKEFITMQGNLFLGTQYSSLTYGQPLTNNKDGWAFSWMRITPPEQDLVSNSGTIEGSFSAKDEAMVLSYGRSFCPMSLGVSLKYISRALQNSTGSGIGYDLGLYYQASSLMSFSLLLKDINETRVSWSSGSVDKTLPSLKLGIAYKPLPNLNIAADASKKLKAGHSYQANLGLEWWPLEILAIRAGADEGKISGGLSLKSTAFQIDYAYINNIDLGETSRVSLLIKI